MTSYNIAPGESGSEASYRRKLAELLMQRKQPPKIEHWTQGLAHMAESAMDGYQLHRLEKQEQDRERDVNERIGSAPGLGSLPPAPPSAGLPVQPMADYGERIAGIESGGKYDALGPVTKSGDRAYGKYQVMGANIPSWTKAHLGQEMSPEQFAASPEAQDAVFKGQFGQYAQKYGPEGAAKAWFAGEGGMNNPNARDQLGTTVASYAQKFSAGGNAVAATPTGQGGAMGPIAPEKMGGAPQGPSINPEMGAYIQRLLGNPRTRALGMQLYQSELTRANTKPTFGEIGTDPQTGQPVRGWIDPVRRQVEPVHPLRSSESSGPGAIPAAPPGVDPKVWREEHSKRKAEEGMPADQKVVSALRKEVQDLPSYKNIAQAAPVYKSMLNAAGRDNRAADVNLIYGMAKIMDPGSVVRESEMGIAQAVATLPQQLRATVESQMNSTGRLTPEVRQAIMQEAHSRIGAYQGMFEQDMGMYRGIAQRGRMNEADVIPSFGAFEEYKAATMPPAPPGGPSPADIGAELKRRKLQVQP